MVSINELRIGNIIMALGNESHGLMQTVIELKHFSWQFEEGDYFEVAEPIPLTPEILEKCGFVKQIGTKANRHAIYFDIAENSHRIYIDKEYSSLHFNAGISWFPKLIEIKTLHQLQNIYFALTNKELEINL